MNASLEDELASAIREYAAGVSAPDALLDAAVANARRGAVRRRVVTGVGGMALAASLAVGVGLLPNRASSHGSSPVTVNAAYITQRLVQALPTQDYPLFHRIISRTLTEPEGRVIHQVFESWFDPDLDRGVNRMWTDGQLQQADGRTYAHGTETFIDVSYRDRTWRRWSQQVDAVIAHDKTGLEVAAPEVRAALQGTGTFTLVGQEQVDGRDAYHLRTIDVMKASGTAQVDVWADARSYQVLKAISTGTGLKETTSYEWFNPTPQALAQLNLTVPAGFRQIP